MKGMVFTEFLEMVEDKFDATMVEKIIDDSELSSNGIYTAVGTYPFQDMAQLITHLSKHSGIAVNDLIRTFGLYLFGRLTQAYPVFLEGIDDCFTFLENVHDFIHVEVKKLYPDAELPSFDCQRSGPNQLIMDYRSPRCLGDLAQGLIEGCAEHFDQTILIERHTDPAGGGSQERFILTLGN